MSGMTSEVCSDPECSLPVRTRGMCQPHYAKGLHGHEFTEENTRLTAKGRDCRACNRDRYWRNRERLNKQKRDKRALLNPPTEGETDE